MKGVFLRFIGLLLVQTGCATIATDGDLPVIEALPKTAQKSSTTYRFYVRTELRGKRGVILEYDEHFNKTVKAALEDSGYFSNVVDHERNLARVHLLGENTSKEEALALEIKFPLETDYFINVEAAGIDLGHHGNMYGFLFHFVSLGFFPLWMNNDVDLTVTLYDKRGKQIYKTSVKDKSTIWGWTPLVFFNGFKIFQKFPVVAVPMQRNTLNHALKNVQENVLAH